jgi:hypothetical protein
VVLFWPEKFTSPPHIKQGSAWFMSDYLSMSLEINRLNEIIAERNSQLDKAIGVIEFYANQSNWMGWHRDVDTIRSCDLSPAKATEDGFDIMLGGKKARQFLEEFNL